jgi:O-antigen ligase
MMVDPRRMKEILLAAFLSTAFPLLFTSFGFLIGHPRSEAKGAFTRIVGTFNQSNDFGRYLMLMLIMGAAIYPHLDKRLRTFMGVGLAGMSVFLFLTYTRSALIAAGLGLLVVGVLQSKRLLVGLFVAGLVGLFVVPSLSGRFTDLTQYQSKQATVGGAPNSGNTLAWRLSYWTEVLPLANHNPVTGIGLNMTQYNTDKAKQPHNDFIRAYVETGIIGFIAYVAMMIALVGMGRRAVRAAPEPSLDRGVAIGFLGCAVAFLAVSVVANVISNVVNLWYFFTFAAAASAIVQRRLLAAQASDYRLSGPTGTSGPR